MSKGKKKSAYNAPPKTAEKYLDNLAKVKSEETYAGLDADQEVTIATSTDEPIAGTVAAVKPPESSQVPWWWPILCRYTGYALTIATGVGMLVAICVFFYAMNESIIKANGDIQNVKSQVEKVEGRLERSSETLEKGQGDIKLTLVDLANKLERLLDRANPKAR